jgi:hypothetical protein
MPECIEEHAVIQKDFNVCKSIFGEISFSVEAKINFLVVRYIRATILGLYPLGKI